MGQVGPLDPSRPNGTEINRWNGRNGTVPVFLPPNYSFAVDPIH